jgi:two-component system response regulator MtrA
MLRALVVDPDNVRGSAVVCDLSEEGFLATRVSGVQEVMAVLASSAPDVVLSEFDLGTSDAADLAKVARRMSDVPIVVLADERPPNQVIAALEAGVDKYLQRPCSPQELAARIRSLLRRTGASIDLARALIVGNLEVDPAAMTVRKDGAMVPLTRNELELLLVLARRPGAVFTHECLTEEIWGISCGGNGALRTTVKRLRSKLEREPSCPEIIRTARGVGYYLDR